MADAEPNYFTCTLGEALRLRHQGIHSVQSYETVIDLIDKQARDHPESPALGFASLKDEESTHNVFPRVISFSELCELSKCAERALSPWVRSSNVSSTPTVGLLCTSSFDFVFTCLGLMRSGFSVLLLAPQLEPQGIQHLCETLQITKIFVDMAHTDRATTVSGIDFLRILSLQQLLGSEPPKEPLRRSGIPRDSKMPDIAYICHTSGTSSGLPKPIPQTQFGVVGALPVFPGENKPATFSTTPLYHGGFADCMRAWTSGAMIWFFPERQAPITGATILRAISFARNKDSAPVKYFSSVPYVLQMLAEEEQGIQVLQSMDLVGVGGAALPPAVGDKLVEAGVNLLSRMGSAECGFLMSSHRDYAKDKEWQYLRVINDAELLSFEARESGLSELVVKPGWPFKVKTNRDDGSYATSDLFESHPFKPNAWRYHSRADAQITLANGKKFDPSPMEGSILASTNMLQDVLIFGSGRDYAGVLLFPVSDKISQKELIDSVWSHIEQMNNDSQSHTRIAKTMLVFVPTGDGGKPLEKSSKGTTLRRQAEERYAEEIDSSYNARSLSGTKEKQIPDEQLTEAVLEFFSQVLGRKVEPDQDLYRQGVDSIACIQIRKLIESACLSPDTTLTMNVIYDQGTVTALVDFLRRVRGGLNVQERTEEQTQLPSMHQLAEKYSDFGVLESTSGIGQGNSVVLTGATGFLGAHILHLLRQDVRVDKVYCLLRATCPQSAHERVSKALSNRGMPRLGHFEESAHHDKIICLPCDLSNEDLGLPQEHRQRIMNEAAVVIHSAWTVNFNLRLDSFEDQISATRNLVKLAAEAQARLIFVSSTAAVSNATTAPIPEKISQDPLEASPMGYSRSKWVAEQICESANEHFPSDENKLATVVRIGQLCSNDAGIWNASEAYPLLLSTARVAGCLPDIPHEMLNWLPVGEAAQSVMEIVFSGHFAKPEDSESVSPTKTPVYHVLNPRSTPTWSEMLRWILDSGEGPEFETVSPREWLSRLEESLKEREDNHPSQALLGLWKQNYCQDGDNVGEAKRTPAFELARTQQVSTAMRGVKPLDSERVLKMWKWVREAIKS